MPQAMSPQASVVIPTWNRREDLRVTLQSLAAQSVPLEILVMDDGSTDGTDSMIRQEFPDVAYHRRDHGNGPTKLRNEGVQMARCQIVFPFDNDINLVSPRSIEQTLDQFGHPRIAVVGVPYIEIKWDSRVRQEAPDSSDIWIMSQYMGAVCGVRRDIFRMLGGYRAELYYWGEESDYAMRLLDHGYVVRAGSADPVHHVRSSTSRPNAKSFRCARRNGVWFGWYYVPWRHLPIYQCGVIVHGLKHGISEGHLISAVHGVGAGLATAISCLSAREAVALKTYRVFRRLRREGLVPLSDIEPDLNPVQTASLNANNF